MKQKDVEIISGDVMVNVNKNHHFLDMLKDQLIDHQEKQIIGLLNINKNVEAFLKK